MNSVTFTFDGRQLSAEEGLTIAEALKSNGIRLGGRSMRLRVWRDEYHPLKEVPSAWVTVDGVANINAYRMKICSGMRIAAQTRRSLLAYIGRYSGTGFYYRNFTRSETARNFFFERVKRTNDYGGPMDPEASAASSIGELDFRPSASHSPDILIVGAGRSGLSALMACAPSAKVIVVDALPGEKVEENFKQLKLDLSSAEYAGASSFAEGSESLDSLLKSRNATLLDNTRVFGAFDGLFTAVSGYSQVHLIRPRTVILATGCEEVKPLFRRNDIPGIMTGRTLLTLPGKMASGARRAVLLIDSPVSPAYLTRISAAARPASVYLSYTPGRAGREAILSSTGIDSSALRVGVPLEAGGALRVENITVQLQGGARESVAADMIICAGRRQPRMEIASLLSLETGMGEEGMPVPEADGSMRCVEGVYACGSLLHPSPVASVASGMAAGIAAGASLSGIGAQPPAALTSLLRHEPARRMETEHDGRTVVCPCLDVTLADMRKLYSEGYDTINRMRRFSGLFMGPCQGARCYRNTFEEFMKLSGGKLDLPTVRPPLVPVYLGALALTDMEDE